MGKAPKQTQFLRILLATRPGLAGTSVVLLGQETVIGRSRSADVVLDDPSVSRRHVRLSTVEGELMVDALTQSNGTFVDGVPVGLGRPRVWARTDGPLQLGGVLLTQGESRSTTNPVLHPLELRRTEPVLTVRWWGESCIVRWSGQDVGLSGTPARLVGTLAGSAGAPVPREQLEEVLNTTYVYPVVSRARTVLTQAMAAGMIDPTLVRRCLDLDADVSVQDLGRQLIQNHRSFGYILRLHPEHVAVVDPSRRRGT